ncbi:MAG: hypothetical protein KGZ62_01930 [Sulfurimonas sp.]|nr:hypothetical protein [Sulfurimonas sp.]
MKENIKNIIDKSINKFLYIDDRVCLPYEESNDYQSTSQSMYETFQEANKHLRIVRYNPIDSVEDYKKMFDNNDILILDWHLDGDEIDEKVFDIIYEAVKHRIIKYIFVYTGYQDRAYIDLLSAFDSSSLYSQSEDELERLNEIIACLDISCDEDTFLQTEVLDSIALELIQGSSTVNKYIEKFANALGVDEKNLKKELGTSNFSNQFGNLAKFFYYKKFSETSHRNLDINLSHIGKNNNLVLDSTHIMVIPKDIEPAMLLETMYSSLSGEPHGFFNFLNHEILYKFHDFFFHQAKRIGQIQDSIVKQKLDGHELEDFIETVYSDIFRSVIRNNEMSLINGIDGYFHGKNLTAVDDKVLLQKLNYFLSSNIDKENLDFITRKKTSFGDIFKIKLVHKMPRISQYEKRKFSLENLALVNRQICQIKKDKFSYQYAICITQHCDSLRPEKIDNMYSFVFAKELFKSEPSNLDELYCSFIEENEEVKIVNWADSKIVKPRTLYIKNVHDIRNPIEVKYGECILSLDFIAQQKDIFTQRLANEAFRYPMRVGVSYVDKGVSCKC